MFTAAAAAVVVVNVIIVIIVHNDLAGFQRGLVTDQALLIHYSAENFQIIWHILNITALCIRIYRPG
jgi:hypothetical protein